MKNVIIFDVGNVIMLYKNKAFNDWLNHKFNGTKEIAPIWKKWLNLGDLDKISANEFYTGFLKEVGIDQNNLSEKEFFGKFFGDYVLTNEKILKFIKDFFFNKYELYIFSNMNKNEIIENNLKSNYESFFKKCVYSCNIKLKKPDIEFYQKALELIGHKGEECIFFDDNIKNKENAEKTGIKFVQYIDFNKFLTDVKELKLT